MIIKQQYILPSILLLLSICACSEPEAEVNIIGSSNDSGEIPLLVGKWITEHDGSVMRDPQTSGLALWQGKLLSISDGSAHETQRLQLHVIDPETAQLNAKTSPIKLGSRVRRSCFSSYLADQPDLEAMVVDPNDNSVVYLVTEDATRTGALSVRCQNRYSQTGSTDYPTLLVRVKIATSGQATMTHVRPIQFAVKDAVGDFPNDGIEGLAITPDKTLYLGLEKDKVGAARIFKVTLNDAFWKSTDFAKVTDAKLQLPVYAGGNHPINGLTWHTPNKEHPGFLIAAARNDDELWIVDITGKAKAKRVLLRFAAEIKNQQSSCGTHEIMDNASIEGLAIIGDQLYLVNDPWKRNYLKNIQCPDNAGHYMLMAPLLYSMPLEAEWFSSQR